MMRLLVLGMLVLGPIALAEPSSAAPLCNRAVIETERAGDAEGGACPPYSGGTLCRYEYIGFAPHVHIWTTNCVPF